MKQIILPVCVVTLLVVLSVVMLNPTGQETFLQGKIAPLLPEEFSAGVVQNKFNQNGFGVNHTCVGTYYSSFKRQVIRSDCAA